MSGPAAARAGLGWGPWRTGIASPTSSSGCGGTSSTARTSRSRRSSWATRSPGAFGARDTLALLRELADEGNGAFGLSDAELTDRVDALSERTGEFERETGQLAARLTSVTGDFEDELDAVARRTDNE